MPKLESKLTVASEDVSHARAEAFLQDYLRRRVEAGATEKIFQRFGAFQEQVEENNAAAIGFNVVIRKWPLLDLGNWGPLDGWEFAVAEERRLLQNFETALAKCAEATHRLAPLPAGPLDAGKLLKSADRLSAQLTATGFNPQVVVFAMPIEIDTLVELNHLIETPCYELGPELACHWILGQHHGTVLVHLDETESRRIYAVDVRGFGRLVQFSPSADLTIDDAPIHLAITAKATDPYNSVHIRLYQSYELSVQNCLAVQAAEARDIAGAA